MKWLVCATLGLCALFGAANVGYSRGWEARDQKWQCMTSAAERQANARRIDAALRGFIDDRE